MIQRTFRRSLNGWSGVSAGPYSGWNTTFFLYFAASRLVVPIETVERTMISGVSSQEITLSTTDVSHDPSSALGVGTQTNAASHLLTSARVPNLFGSSKTADSGNS